MASRKRVRGGGGGGGGGGGERGRVPADTETETVCCVCGVLRAPRTLRQHNTRKTRTFSRWMVQELACPSAKPQPRWFATRQRQQSVVGAWGGGGGDRKGRSVTTTMTSAQPLVDGQQRTAAGRRFSVRCSGRTSVVYGSEAS
jgi:hypothetical protein